MELRRVKTRDADSRHRSRSSPMAGRKTSPVQASLQWVTARVPPDLVRDIEAHGKRSGTTRSEAIRECLAVGIETIRHREGVPRGRVEEILGAIEGARLRLGLRCPPAFGTPRLPAPWASPDRPGK